MLESAPDPRVEPVEKVILRYNDAIETLQGSIKTPHTVDGGTPRGR
jgi:hypothetical protein